MSVSDIKDKASVKTSDKPKKAPGTILTLCAHNDDNIIGVGGTIAKHVDEGGKAYSYIFCYGDMSHPHLKREVILKTRVKESHKAGKILGDEIYYLGFTDGKILEDAEKRNIKQKLKDIINLKKPTKIFTHSLDDPHPDHKAVLKLVTEVCDEINYKGEVFSFDIWNPINIRKRDSPKLVVDITSTFKKKLDSFKVHKSQKMVFFLFIWQLWIKAIMTGWQHHYRYAESFYKIR